MESERSDEARRMQSFLDELEALSRRTGIWISGCGCCDSPRIEMRATEEEASADGRYVVGYDPTVAPGQTHTWRFAMLRWRDRDTTPSQDPDWRAGLDEAPGVLPVLETQAERMRKVERSRKTRTNPSTRERSD